MDTKWLEDFVALVEHGSFTRAAESRYVTQSAFSRRIRALENWLGVELVDRNVYPLKLTRVGREFLVPMRNVLRDVDGLRAGMRDRARSGNRIVVATQHSLSVSFCPAWYARFRPYLGENGIYIKAKNLYECVDIFLAKQCNMLLCYCTSQIAGQLERDDVERLQLGEEELLPVCATDDGGNAACDVRRDVAIPVIGFPAESFFGDLIQTECLPAGPDSVRFNVVYETALSEGVRSLVMKGAGMGWLPGGLIKEELESGALVVMDGLQKLQLTIMLYRFRSDCDQSIADFWSVLESSP